MAIVSFLREVNVRNSSKQLEKPLKFLALSIFLLLSGSLMLLPAYANQETSKRYYYQIQSGSLSNALNQIAQQANVTILFNTQKLSGYKASALSGSYTAQQAFEKILENTPFLVQKTPAGYLLQDGYLSLKQTSSVSAATVTNKL